MAKILVIEDDRQTAEFISDYLSGERHDVQLVEDGHDGLSRMKTYQYDLVILDWTLPGIAGVDLCKQARAAGVNTPVLMVTAKSAVSEKEVGFDVGADDYLTKPFDIRELSARVKALLRRPQHIAQTILRFGDVVLDVKAHKVTFKGEAIHLRPQEFNLLEFLMRHPHSVFSPETLLERVWDSDSEATRETVRTHINRLRAKLESKDGPTLIHTLFGIGYRLGE